MSSADAAAYGAHTGDAEAGKLLDGVHKEAVELESRLADHRVPLQLALRWLGGTHAATAPAARRSASCSACAEHFPRRGSDHDRTS